MLINELTSKLRSMNRMISVEDPLQFFLLTRKYDA